MLVQVRFRRHYDVYNSGEIAGFTPELAKRLTASGAAELVAVDAVSEVKVQPTEVEELGSAANFKSKGRK